ncbi:MAG: DUF481 domain-containing protein, partial [Tepidisphaeraceae bacterium]
MTRWMFAGALVGACLAGAVPAIADEVLFKNGDKLTGKVVDYDGKKVTIDSKVAGKVSVDMKDVQTFTTDEPITIRLQ